ncbi:T9SS type A sorting domain-containing protein [Polaribacter sp. Asnod6-C07]|uniref:T9SS type A sorting domain-containing protein n=1 Tax=Polaribacter sp. Asnod6-C07 TaxID=3160582 RepID=UPI00386EEEEE
MKRNFLNVTLFFLTSFVVNTLHAQEPNWSVNPIDFQHSMTFTTFLNVNGNLLTSENDKVAAFIEGEVRGVANVTYIESRNKYVAFLTVFSNSNNKEISFKIYDSQNETIVEVDKKEIFVIDGNLGGVFQSYSLANPVLNNQAELLDFSFENITEITKTTVDNTINFVLSQTTDISNLIPVFNVSEGAKIFIDIQQQISGNSAIDYTVSKTYTVVSQDEAVSKEYIINVTKETNTINIITILSSNADKKINTNSIQIDVNFSKEIIDFSTAGFELTNAVISEFIKLDDQNYKLTLIAVEEGVFSIMMKENQVQDAIRSQNLASNILEFSFDETAPIITDLELQEELNQQFFTIIFNEPVENVNTTDFEFVGTQSKNYTKQELIKINDKEYRLTITKTNDDLGSVYLKIKADSDIKDDANNTILLQETQSFYLDNLGPIIDTISDATGECEVIVIAIPKAIDAVSGEVLGTTQDALTFVEQGEYAITWSFDDGNGNIFTTNQNVFVKDETNPEVKTKDFELKLNATGNGTLKVSDIDDGSFDNCGIESYNLSKTNFTTDNLGENTIVFTVEDVNGNSTSVNVTVTVSQESLSTDNFQLKNYINIYPNPVKEKIFLDIKNSLNIHKIEVFSIDGKKLISKKEKTNFINLKNLKPGFYFMKINSEKGILVHKFLRE